MDVITQIIAVPNIHAFLLLASRGLSVKRIKQAVIETNGSVLMAYALSNERRKSSRSGESATEDLKCKVDIRALAARLDLAPTLTGALIQLLVPDVLARMHRRLRDDSGLLEMLRDEAARRDRSAPI